MSESTFIKGGESVGLEKAPPIILFPPFIFLQVVYIDGSKSLGTNDYVRLRKGDKK